MILGSFSFNTFGLRRCAAALAAVLALSACTTPDYTRRAQVRSVIVDGIDIAAMNTVLARGFTEIKDRAFDEPDVDVLFNTALLGFNHIDPALQVAVHEGHVVVFVNGVQLADIGPAPRGNVAAWSETTVEAALAARKVSALLHLADEEAMYKAFFDAALTTLDPFSRYASRQDAGRNRLVRDGVIGLGVRVELVNDGAIIQSIVRGGPGDLAGLRINDVILSADGSDLRYKSLLEVRRRLDGAAGTVVTLAVRRPEERDALIIAAARDLVVPDTVSSRLIDGVVELRIRSFNQRTAYAVEKALLAARDENSGTLKGVVLDMRGDPGGLLDQAIDIADLFLDQGAIVTLHGRHPGARQYYTAHRGDIALGAPVAVVVDGKTASAAEIVAAALQDNKRAAVVGTVSWGKGSVQTVIRLPNSGEIALTWARAQTPRGVALHGLGLLPDICLRDEPSVGDVIEQMFSGSSPSADTRRSWRAPADDLATHEALRTACPSQPRPDSAVDLEVARRIVSDPALLALAIPDTAAQLAVKP